MYGVVVYGGVSIWCSGVWDGRGVRQCVRWGECVVFGNCGVLCVGLWFVHGVGNVPGVG